MKKSVYITCLFLLMQVYSSAQQFTEIHEDGVNIGIGITIPKSKLHVHGQSIWLTGGDGFGLGSSAGKGLRLYYHHADDHGVIRSYDYGAGDHKNVVINPHATEGNVGIGTTSPEKRLDVNGDVIVGRSGNSGRIDFRRPNDGAPAGSLGFAGAAENSNFRLASQGGGGYLSFWTNGGGTTEKMRITPTGEVGIGTTNPTSLLTVAGKIESREVKVTVGAGADFVFEDDYPLKEIDQLEAFIKKNKHLPEIAPEREMIENGLEVGEFQIKLLQKIEELTLYIIDQEKRIKKLEAINTQLTEDKKK